VPVIALGTVLWSVVLLVLVAVRLVHGRLGGGRDDWLWIALAGVGLGLLGLRTVHRRRAALRRATGPEPADDPGQGHPSAGATGPNQL